MKFKIKAYNLQELGQRTNQEDSLFPALGKSTSDDRLFVLCDGMGGHEKGEVASATVCATLSRVILSAWHPGEVLSDELFLQALSAAYDALDAKDNGEERKMGTTLTFLCLHASGATVAHIGDSRIYQLRPASKNTSARIVFRTQDHSLVNDLVKIGEITEEEAKHHPQKNVITRAMQPCQEHRAKADIAHLTDILPGDYFYMCSDGMLEEASDENILNIITKPNATDEQKLEMLRNVTEENKDNHTAHLIHIDKVEGDASIASNEESHSPVKGIWITPDFNKPKKKRKVWPWIVGIAVIAVIAAAASFFMCGGKNCASELVGDSIKLAPAKVRPIEQKKDTLKKDTATSNVINKFVKPSQPKNEKRDKTNNPNEKTK
ncbi:PP2C family protein-serine/threonine phosphatase [Leyella stercorea]|uniref:PP2C family protein-serine/threonine phosphatase n=1 Tax=Leyella stercorea TaxID=363265 RepID=UPI002FE428C9